MTLEEIRGLKKQYGYTNEQISRKSGVPLATVQKVFGGTTRSPRYQTILALASAFPEFSGKEPRYKYAASAQELPILRDVGSADAAAPKRFVSTGSGFANMKYPRQGTYTLDDYLALPDDQRVELIDGVFYDMRSPSIPHQMIGGKIHAMLLDFITRNGGNCMPFIAPTDVLLDPDNRTVVEPDVMIVCDRSKITRARIIGAPDFVMEVLSPDTRAKDVLIKPAKYKNAGVKEYWMVDIKNESVTKMLFGEESQKNTDDELQIEQFSFDIPVPVTLFEGNLSVNFREIADSYSFLQES